MSTAAIIAIAVGALVVLAVLAFVTLARRSDVRGAGALSGETVRRDRDARAVRADAEDRARESRRSAAAAEAEGVLAREDAPVPAPVPEADLVPWSPPDPEALGSAVASSSTGPTSR